jgi:type IV fimbrial biogenesis protein FimT
MKIASFPSQQKCKQICRRLAPHEARHHGQLGLTVIELLVVVAIVAILASLATPSFTNSLLRNRATAEVNQLAGDLQFARAEAIKEGQTVTICTSSNGTTCQMSTNWNGGWIIFSDANGNQKVDTGETILRAQKKWLSADTFAADHSISAITFSSDGLALNLPGAVTVTLHTTPQESYSTQCLILNVIGHLQIQNSGTGNCT